MNTHIYIPVSLRLIQWTKEVVQNGTITEVPRQCYAHTTSQGRVMKIGNAELNTTTTLQVNGVDLTQRTAGLSYAKWYWEMNDDMYQSMLDLRLGKCYMKVSYDGTLDNINNEELVSQEEYDSLQEKPSIDDYLHAQVV